MTTPMRLLRQKSSRFLTHALCMDGLDLYETLQQGLSLNTVLEQKVRRAAETPWSFHRLRDMF
jgi:hypothetical protein